MRPDGNARGETVEVTEPIENPARHAQRAPMNQERGQGREIHHALRTAFWVLAVAIGLWGLHLALSGWRAFPAWSLLLAAYLLVAGPGAVAWCWRQLARFVGRDPDKVAPDWLGDGPLLLQLFVRGNPFRGSAAGREPWGAVLRQLQGAGRLAGLVVYGSPYLWEQLEPLLEPGVAAVYSPGQMPLAQELALGALGLGHTDGHGDFTD